MLTDVKTGQEIIEEIQRLDTLRKIQDLDDLRKKVESIPIVEPVARYVSSVCKNI